MDGEAFNLYLHELRAGNDRLSGGQGDDLLTGGTGDGDDTVTDFGNGADEIDLSAFGVESVEALGMTITEDGVVVDMTGFDGGTILLAGLTALPGAEGFIV